MIPLLLAVLCVAANAFFVAAEFAFAKVRPSSLEALARTGDVRAARALRMTGHLDAYLSATQLGITLASLGLGWLGEPALADLIEPPLAEIGASEAVVHGIAYSVAFATISLLHIVVGELVPKSLAIQRPETVSRVTGWTLRVFFLVTYPAMVVLNGLSNAILRLMRLPPVGHSDGKMSPEEMRVVIQASFGDVNDRKRDLLERVLRGTDRPIRAVMVPRVDMVTVAEDDTVGRCLDLVRRHGHSRYPLCEDGDPDRVLGYVHVKDVLTASAQPEQRLEPIRRDVLFVPEGNTVGEVLSEFQMTSIPFAIIVDEYGGTSGLVTVEDVVEEMVGDIQDEHDLERPRVVSRDDGTVAVDGAVGLDELDFEGLELQPIEGADTLGGWVVGSLGRLARPGDQVRAGAWDLRVEDVRRRRVARVAMSRRPPSEPPAEEARSSEPPPDRG